MLAKILLVAIVILIINRMMRYGASRTRTAAGRDRKSIPGVRQAAGAPLRVQCPWCGSWDVSQYRDLRGIYWFLLLLTFGLILLFFPIFPRTNKCNHCGKRWSFGSGR